MGIEPESLRIGDFNGDGKQDLAAANFNCPSPPSCGPGSVSILLGKGDGTFQTNVDYATGTEPENLLLRDFNGDGKLDLAVVNSGDDTISILLGKGDGTFQTRVDYLAGSGILSLIPGDFNGDGKLDLATANSNNTVSILLGKGDGTFQAHVDYPIGATFGRSTSSVFAADFNGDGKLDLAVVNAFVPVGTSCLVPPPACRSC